MDRNAQSSLQLLLVQHLRMKNSILFKVFHIQAKSFNQFAESLKRTATTIDFQLFTIGDGDFNSGTFIDIRCQDEIGTQVINRASHFPRRSRRHVKQAFRNFITIQVTHRFNVAFPSGRVQISGQIVENLNQSVKTHGEVLVIKLFHQLIDSLMELDFLFQNQLILKDLRQIMIFLSSPFAQDVIRIPGIHSSCVITVRHSVMMYLMCHHLTLVVRNQLQ